MLITLFFGDKIFNGKYNNKYYNQFKKSIVIPV